MLTMPNGVQMPIVGLGTWEAGCAEQLKTALRTAFDNGYRHIDTAYFYGNEDVIGEVIDEYIQAKKLARADIFVTTKVPECGVFLRKLLLDINCFVFLRSYLLCILSSLCFFSMGPFCRMAGHKTSIVDFLLSLHVSFSCHVFGHKTSCSVPDLTLAGAATPCPAVHRGSAESPPS